jgi:Ca2+-binding EF-hand superfamily protein
MDENKNYVVDFNVIAFFNDFQLLNKCSNYVYFQEYVGSSVLSRGSRLQHLIWAFNAFDNHKHGYITDQDLFIGLRGEYNCLRTDLFLIENASNVISE